MSNWIDRARREIPKMAKQGTAVTAERTLTAVLAVPHMGESGIFGVSNVSIGSTPATGFWKIGFRKGTGVDTSPPTPRISWTARQQAKRKSSKSPALGKVPAYDDRLSYPARRQLYAKQNALCLRLHRRLERFERPAADQDTAVALAAWASDEAMTELYTGQRSWEEQRKHIYAWAKATVATVRRHRELVDERAAIMEFDGGLNRVDAELKAGLHA